MRRKKFGGQEIQHDGATERIVYARKLWGKKRNDDYTEYRSSFALNNGEYAYQDWDEDNQREFFHVVKIRDPNVFKLLDEADHDEEKDDRHAEEASDYAQLRYEAMAEAQEEEALASPLEKAEYQLFRYKDQAEKALADRNAGKPNYKNAVGKYVVKADGTADPIDVTRLMARDQETGELLMEGTTFYVVESVAPQNYKLSDRVASVLVTPKNTKENPAVFKVKDEPVILKGDIELIKHYDHSDSPLEGAVFEIENLASHEKLQIVTDEDGYATTKREECPEGTLEIGAYQVTEIDAKGAQREEPMRVMIGWEQEINPDGTVEWKMPVGGPKSGAVYRIYDTNRDNGDEVITDMPQPELGTVAMAVDPMELDMVKDLNLSAWQGTAGALTREIGEQLEEGQKVLSAKEEVSLYDLCVVQNLRCDTDYTLVGTLMTVDAEGRVKPFTRPR